MSVTPQKVFVNLRKGKGLTAFSVGLGGNLEISDAGVSYTGMVSGSHNHSYPFSQISSTNFEMTHAGLQPLFAYVIYLKSGEKYIYCYSPLLKSQLQSIDNVIRSNITAG